MNIETIKRLFPNASASLIQANLQDYGQAHVDTGLPTTKPAQPAPALGATDEGKAVDDDNNSSYPSLMSFDTEKLYEAYLRTKSVHRAALEFETTGETVRRYLLKAGKKLGRSLWSKEDDKVIQETRHITARAASEILGRTETAVNLRRSRMDRGKAKTNSQVENRNCATCGKSFLSFGSELNCSVECFSNGEATRIRLCEKAVKKRRFFLERQCITCGKTFTPTSRTPTKTHCSILCGQRDFSVAKKRIESTRANPNAKKTSYASCRKGWLEIGGKRIFFRSSWEANYARYLQWQKQNGLITNWEHEPKTFWFEKIKRGVRSYLPDFQVTMKNGNIEWHEVKGWMDGKSKTKIKRLAKYYPKEVLRVIGHAWFKDANRKLATIIPGWNTERVR